MQKSYWEYISEESIIGILFAIFLYTLFIFFTYLAKIYSAFIALLFPGFIMAFPFLAIWEFINPNLDSAMGSQFFLLFLVILSSVPWVISGGLYGAHSTTKKAIGKVFILFFIFFFISCGTLAQLFYYLMQGSVLDN